MNPIQPSTQGIKGLEAIERRDLSSAYHFLDAAFKEGDRHKNVLIGLAFVARSTRQFEVCLLAIDLFLQEEPNDINANIVKGDALISLGRSRSAVSFYVSAIRISESILRLPPNLAKDIQRIKIVCGEVQQKLENEMSSHLSQLQLNTFNSESRVGQMVDILMGQKQIFPQNPSKLYFPELPHIQFFDPSIFSWISDLMAFKNEIEEELLKLLSLEKSFEPYMDHNPDAATGNMNLAQNDTWSAFHLFKDGKEVAENIAKCPKTYQAISSLPIARIPGRSPNILFSKLGAGGHIPPHHGQLNVRLLCHLPLVVPDGCTLRVGNQVRKVVCGQPLIFDDSIEHEAYNTSNEERIVLIFDLWRPELSKEEREAVCSILEKIETLS